MRNALKITKYIKEIVEQNAEIIATTGLWQDNKIKIYPIDAKEGSEFPFIVIQRTNVIPNYCKDGNYHDEVYVSVIAVASSYDESVDIQEKLRNALEGKGVSFDDNFKIRQIECVGFQENIYQDAFIQGIDLKIDI